MEMQKIMKGIITLKDLEKNLYMENDDKKRAERSKAINNILSQFFLKHLQSFQNHV